MLNLESLEPRNLLAALVGVDFDDGPASPNNWTSIGTSTTPFTATDLTDETGTATAIDLTITGANGSIEAVPAVPAASTIPTHTQSLVGIDGQAFTANNAVTFTWGGLVPGAEYEIYVIALEDFWPQIVQDVTITGAATVSFQQSFMTNELFINDAIGSDATPFADYAEVIEAPISGEIIIQIDPGAALNNDVSVGGLAIRQIGDLVGFTVTETAAATFVEESGTTDLITVVLDAQPTSNVVIDVTSSNVDEATVTPDFITFTPANWDSPQNVTVTGVDELIDDGDMISDITFSINAAASDDAFDSLGDQVVQVTTIDDDDPAPPLVIDIADIDISENGGVTSGTVTRPGDVATELTVNLISSDTSEASVPATISIPAGQATSAPFTITGVDDAIVDGAQPVVITASAIGLSDGTGGVIVSDDDAALTLAIVDASISENSGTTTATVTRNSDTAVFMQVTIETSDNGEAVAPATVSILPGQATSAPFTITGVDDLVLDGSQTVTFTASALDHSSAMEDVEVLDDELPNLSVAVLGTQISENGGSTTATVSRPTASATPLTVTLVSDDTTEASVPASVMIPANATTSAAFTITAVDDAIVDGTRSAVIRAAAPGHSDGAGVIAVTDDEVASLSISIVDTTIPENGGASVATVTRNGPLGAPMIVALQGDDASELNVPATVVIPAGATTSAPFSLDAIDDLVSDGTQVVEVSATALIGPADSLPLLDASFGATGVVNTGLRRGTQPRSHDIQIQADGKIVVAGTADSNADEWFVHRYNADGSLDSAFGTDGVAASALLGTTDLQTQAIDVHADGRIVVVGRSNELDFIVARYNADGSPDLTFGTGGLVTTPPIISTDSVEPFSVLANDDGSLFITGRIAENGGGLLLVKLNADGSVDTVVEEDLGNNRIESSSLERQADGKLVISGVLNGVDNALFVTRYFPDMTLDLNFATDGTQIITAIDGNSADVVPLVIQADGKIVVGATQSSDFGIVRLNANGTMDTTFGNGGAVILDSPTGGIDELNDLVVDSSQRIVVVGSTFEAGVGTNRAIVRLTPDGSVDPLFGDAGYQALPQIAENVTHAAELTADGRLILLSGGGVDLRVERYSMPEPSLLTSALINVTDDEPAGLFVTIVEDAILETGGTTTATVGRSLGTTGDLTVTLVSDDVSEATVPLSVVIPDGASSVSFDITIIDDALSDGTQTVAITASAAGLIDGTDSIDVNDDDLPMLTINLSDLVIAENGGFSVGTVTRNTDTTNDLFVILSSDDLTEATVPATVLIPAGATTSLPFNVQGVNEDIIDGTQTVTISADVGAPTIGDSISIDVTDDDDSDLRLFIFNDTISENAGTTSAVVSRRDTTFPLAVTLTSDDTTEATVPSTVFIPAGLPNSAPFTISGLDDLVADGSQIVTITASAFGLDDATDSVEVTDDEIAMFTVQIVDPEIAENGGTTTATVSRNTDTTSALTVNLSTDDPTEVSIPSSVVIAAGASTSLPFTITGVDDSLADGTQTAAIEAFGAGIAPGIDFIDVTNDDEAILTIDIVDSAIAENGAGTTFTVSRNSLTGSPLFVSLSNSDTTEASVQSIVTIPAGSFTSAPITISGRDDFIVDGTQTVTITASATGHTDASGTLGVTDVDVPELNVSIFGFSISENGGVVGGVVSRNTDTTNPLTVTLQSDDLTEASVPATVEIPAGANSVSFAVSAVDDTLVDLTQVVTITASEANHASSSRSLNVIDDDIALLELTIDNTSIPETGMATATVSRNTDTTDPLSVRIFSIDRTEAIVPREIVIPAGSLTSDPFPITAVDDLILDGDQSVELTAVAVGHLDAVQIIQVLDDEIPELSLSLLELTIPENEGSTTARVFRNTDTSTDLDVMISVSDGTELTTLEMVTIAAGETSSPPFVITGLSDAFVDGDQVVTVSVAAVGHAGSVATLNVVDEDIPSVALDITSRRIFESGETTATVSRNTVTTSEVVVSLTSSNTGEAILPATITIAAGQQTSEPFTISGVSDDVVDGNQRVYISAEATDLAAHVVPIVVADEDESILTLSIDQSSISEDDGLAMATVTRNTDSTVDLVVTVTSSDPDEATVPETITILAGELTSEPFEITGVSDVIVDGTQSVRISVVADGHPETVEVIDVTDETIAALGLTIDTQTFSETGGETTATISRNTDTTEDLEVSLQSSDETEASVPATVVIPAGQSTSEPFIISGVSDTIVDGTQVATITVSAPVHLDASGEVSVEDDDVSTVVLVVDNTSLTEGDLATATVSRNANVDEEVTVTLTNDDPTAVAVPASVVIAAGELTSDPFAIFAVDDLVVDGPQTASISVSVGDLGTDSTDIDVSDNDVATVTMSLSTSLISEADGSTTVTLSRNTDTTGPLLVIINSDSTFRAVIPSSATIPAGDSEFQFVITGVDNFIIDDTEEIDIDAVAVNHIGDSAVLSITNDDFAGVSVTGNEDPISIRELFGEHRFQIALTARPLTDVVFETGSSDTTEATVDPGTLTFTPTNWEAPQELVITGIGDLMEDGDVPFDITLTVDAANSDAGFAGIAPVIVSGVTENVTFSDVVVDNDSGQVVVRDRDSGLPIPTEPQDGRFVIDLRGRTTSLEFDGFRDFDGTIDLLHETVDTISYGEGWEVQTPGIFDLGFAHVLQRDDTEVLVHNETPGQHPLERWDVNRDGRVTAIDALLGINFLRANNGATDIPFPTEAGEVLRYYYDVTGDNRASAVDSLQVINRVRFLSGQRAGGVGGIEGEEGSIQSELLDNSPADSSSLLTDLVFTDTLAQVEKVSSFASLGDFVDSEANASAIQELNSATDQAIDDLLGGVTSELDSQAISTEL